MGEEERDHPSGNGRLYPPDVFFRVTIKIGAPGQWSSPVEKRGPGVRYILTTEVSNIYTQGGKVRRIHSLIFAPSFEVVETIRSKLGNIGNISSDGRPIFGFSAKELAKMILDISPDCLIIPAHAWTPWFSVFGANSGFDSIEECFEEMSPHIHAIETGLSSDPEMNWRLSALDGITLLSNSDAHSPSRLGREAMPLIARWIMKRLPGDSEEGQKKIPLHHRILSGGRKVPL